MFKVSQSPTLKIRGLMATKAIKKDQIIETCPVILIPKDQWPYIKKTVLNKYYFDWDEKFRCIVLGYGSLINHSYTPNSRYVYDFKNSHLVFKAIKNIKIGEEITVNYNFYPHSKTPLPGELLDFNDHKV